MENPTSVSVIIKTIAIRVGTIHLGEDRFNTSIKIMCIHETKKNATTRKAINKLGSVMNIDRNGKNPIIAYITASIEAMKTRCRRRIFLKIHLHMDREVQLGGNSNKA